VKSGRSSSCTFSKSPRCPRRCFISVIWHAKSITLLIVLKLIIIHRVTEKVSWRLSCKQLNLENLCYEGKYRQFVVQFKKINLIRIEEN
jgi:hypothetical protein